MPAGAQVAIRHWIVLFFTPSIWFGRCPRVAIVTRRVGRVCWACSHLWMRGPLGRPAGKVWQQIALGTLHRGL